jgi:hypothetical protein
MKQQKEVGMMSRHTIKVTAILLALMVALVALLGFDLAIGRQRLPPVYQLHTLDV